MHRLHSIKDLKLMANIVRKDLLIAVSKAGSGHTAGPLGMADIMTVLYFHFLKIDMRNPKDPNRDRLILSNGHICPVIYSCFANLGVISRKELMTLRKLGSRLQGHPHRGTLPFLETTSGPLGSGISQACGMALAIRQDGRRSKVVVVTSDGEHEEGNTWEGIMLAAKYGLDIIVIMDRNRIQIGGDTEKVMPLDPIKAKYKAFNWKVFEIDGHNMKQIVNVLAKASKLKGPKVIIANTVPGKDVKSIEGDYKWHGKVPNPEELEKFLSELEKVRYKIIADKK